jgi:uncharacterized membrane protein
MGFVAGLRSLTAPAAVSWAANLGWLDLRESALAFMSSSAAVVIFSAAAFAEYVADKLPRTPNRTRPGPLVGRIVMGAFSAACLAESAHESLPASAMLGGIGAVIGAFAGYTARRRLGGLGVKDVFIAFPEDLVAIGLAYVLVTSS